MIVYNCPGRSGKNITPETLYRLSKIPQIAGVKETAESVGQMMDIVEKVTRQSHHFTMLSGDDQYTLPCMLVGGHGIISVISNIVPLQVRALVDAAATDNLTFAREMHYSLLPLVRAAFYETNPIPIKTAMMLADLPSGGLRLPLCAISAENRSKLCEQLVSSDLAEYIEINKSLYDRCNNLATAGMARSFV